MKPSAGGRSLVWPIALVILLATIVGGLGQLLVVMVVLRPLETRDQRARAEIAFGSLQRSVSALRATPDSAALQAMLERARHESELRAALMVRTMDGRLVWDRPDYGRSPGRSAPVAVSGRMPAIPDSGGVPRRRIEAIASRVVNHAGVAIGEVVAMRPRGGPFRQPSTEALILSLPIALLVSLLTAFLTVRWLVARLQRLESLAAQVAGGDLTARVRDPGGDEIGRLAERLNEMTVSLAAVRSRLEAQDSQRRQLFADITHELATPLTSVRGYIETLLDPGIAVSDTERQRYLTGIHEESRRLDRLIRDLFDLARLEAGASPLEPERIDWADLCGNVVERFGPRFEAAGLLLGWAAHVPSAWIDADGHRVVQVIENLLMNELRHVPAGGAVRVELAEAPGAEGQPRSYRLTVSDDGPGVSAEDVPHLFERFYRSAESRRSRPGHDNAGSGLGLAIVREIVHRHGGTVSAERRVPQGLAIRVDLPAASPPSVPRVSAA
jgi:signal transduction histidine kinase